jgi:hypothetical protein
MSKYTPGPWAAVHNDSFWEVVIPWERGEQVDKYCRCVAHAWAACDDDQTNSLNNAESNARLIAAAPEMYEALKYISEGGESWKDCARMARAILAKVDA